MRDAMAIVAKEPGLRAGLGDLQIEAAGHPTLARLAERRNRFGGQIPLHPPNSRCLRLYLQTGTGLVRNRAELSRQIIGQNSASALFFGTVWNGAGAADTDTPSARYFC